MCLKVKGCHTSYAKFGGAACRRFSLPAKNLRGLHQWIKYQVGKVNLDHVADLRSYIFRVMRYSYAWYFWLFRSTYNIKTLAGSYSEMKKGEFPNGLLYDAFCNKNSCSNTSTSRWFYDLELTWWHRRAGEGLRITRRGAYNSRGNRGRGHIMAPHPAISAPRRSRNT